MTERIIGGRYRLERRLGRSSMAEVWLARDVELERPIALKLLAPQADAARFAREARAVASLAHPNVVQLYDYGEADGRPFMALEYVPGKTLEEALAGGEALPDARAQTIAAEIAAGLAHAHARGLVHRDLKPANVLFDDEGRAKISDFGIASMSGADTITEAGTVLGTAAYISPEQAAGQPASPASDVYSFGVMLFRMLTGRLPFEGDTVVELAAKHRNEPPPAVDSFRRNPPPALTGLTEQALQKDPAARPRDGAALVAALAAGGESTGAIAETMVLRPRRRRGLPMLPIAAALVLAALGALAAVLLTQSSSKAPAAPARGPSHSVHTTHTAPATQSSTASSTSTTTTTTRPTTTPPPTTTRPPTTTPTTTPPTTTTIPTTTTVSTTGTLGP